MLAEDERMLKNMLMELNDRCEDYGVKININKTKTMVIGRKLKKKNTRIKGESIEQVGSFKYLGSINSSNMKLLSRSKAEDSNGKRSL